MSEATNGEMEETTTESTEETAYTPPPPGGGPADMIAQEHGVESKEFLESVTRFDNISERVAKIAGIALSTKAGKTNLSEKDTHETKHLTNNDLHRAVSQYPPKNSCMRGGLRKYVYGDNKRPLSEHEKNQLQGIKRDINHTLKQSEGGWLLEEVISKVKQESHQIAERQDNTPDKKGPLERLGDII